MMTESDIQVIFNFRDDPQECGRSYALDVVATCGYNTGYIHMHIPTKILRSPTFLEISAKAGQNV